MGQTVYFNTKTCGMLFVLKENLLISHSLIPKTPLAQLRPDYDAISRNTITKVDRLA